MPPSDNMAQASQPGPQPNPQPQTSNTAPNNPLNYAFLQRVGLGSLSQMDQDSLLASLRKTLELRVGEKLHAQLNEQQVEDFKRFLPQDGSTAPPDPQAARQWLEQNAPNYRDVVAEELSNLEKELKEHAPAILQEVQAAQAQQPAPQQPPAPNPQAMQPPPPPAPGPAPMPPQQ